MIKELLIVIRSEEKLGNSRIDQGNINQQAASPLWVQKKIS